ncbi:IS1 orfA [Escherichia coli]|nr:IS1 orfA [Escherichia coli]
MMVFFEVLQWLLFLSAVPPVQLLKAWCVTVKVLPDISAISALTAVKTWQLQFTYTASQPGTHQKIIDMAMNGVGCRASARIMGVGLNTVLRHLKTQAAVGNLAHTTGQ